MVASSSGAAALTRAPCAEVRLLALWLAEFAYGVARTALGHFGLDGCMVALEGAWLSAGSSTLESTDASLWACLACGRRDERPLVVAADDGA